MTPESSRSGPRLARRARVHFDRVRGTHVILAPEAIVTLTRTAADVLSHCDGSHTVAEIVGALLQKYPGAPIARDVDVLLHAPA